MSNIVKVTEKGTKIIVGGYSYTLQHTLIKTKRWKCSNKTKNNCPGTLSTSWELTNHVLQIEHNHE
ncbi:FLYWCH-type domain-containing protein [Aphis craccivora]|uniref:FLYWCH-type domain-containing protein n=1 Tax=Aphis craccivora TaxID=307492 RepID=A0A6G0XL77_APHCR|nr:FLYWCH-type domain-containing protein [Aphis craccivora]